MRNGRRRPGFARAEEIRGGDLLAHLDEDPRLKPVDTDFVHLFSSWFNRGFLVLRPIDWTTPSAGLMISPSRTIGSSSTRSTLIVIVPPQLLSLGTTNRKIQPCPGRLSTSMVPPFSSTISLVMVSPSPIPFARVV